VPQVELSTQWYLLKLFGLTAITHVCIAGVLSHFGLGAAVVVGTTMAAETVAAMIYSVVRGAGGFFFLGEPRGVQSRVEAVGTIIFLSVLLLLSSALAAATQTGLSIYPIAYGNHSPAELDSMSIQLTLLLNGSIAFVASATFSAMSWLMGVGRVNGEKPPPLFLGTFLPVSVTVCVVYAAVVLVADRAFWVFGLEGLIALGIGLLAILGYSHPDNRLGHEVARFLLYATAAILVLSALAASLALGGFLRGTFAPPPPPESLRSMLFESPRIPWASGTPYPVTEWAGRWRAGLVTMSLISIFSLAVFVGFPAILTVAKFQLEPAVQRERIRQLAVACLPPQYRRALFERLAGAGPSNEIAPEEQARILEVLNRLGLLPPE
jgi:hypothetical protein